MPNYHIRVFSYSKTRTHCRSFGLPVVCPAKNNSLEFNLPVLNPVGKNYRKSVAISKQPVFDLPLLVSAQATQKRLSNVLQLIQTINAFTSNYLMNDF